MSFFKEYPYITETIDASYDPFLNELKECIIIVDQIFTTLIHPDYGMYPKGFESWIKKNKTYTIDAFAITRLQDDVAKEIPYNIFFQKAHDRIIDRLELAKEATENISDQSFDKNWWKGYLSALQDAFKRNSWEDAEKYFLSMPADNPILLSLGPIDTYHDSFFGIKRCYSGWLLIKDISQQKHVDQICSGLSNVSETITYTNSKFRFFVGNLLYAGGEVAKQETMGWSRAENPELNKANGAIKAIAINKVSEQTKQLKRAIDLSITKWQISSSLAERITNFHESNSLLPLILHEYSHTYNKNPKAHQNLKRYYTDIEETRANTYMAYLADILEKQNILPKDTTSYIILRSLLYIPYLYQEYTVKNQREAYYFAGLFWMKKAEEKELIKIDKTITIDEKKFKRYQQEFIDSCKEYLNAASAKINSDNEIRRLKNDLFLFGTDLAIKLSW